MEELDPKLRNLFDAYGAACPDPEPTAGFMPGVWNRIEARRGSLAMLKRLAAATVVAAAAAALVMGVVLIPQYKNHEIYSATYVDALMDDTDLAAFADLTHAQEAAHK